jgi:putative NAD(P)H nitroreductase
MADSEAYECLYSICQDRHSTRKFSSKPVPPVLIDKIIDLASLAPYASNKKNWQIRIVNDKTTIQKMADIVKQAGKNIAESVRSDFQENFTSYLQNFIHFQTASVLLIPTFREVHPIANMMGKDESSFSQWERDNSVKSISCVCMLILLAAQSLGLASCYMTGPLIADQEISELIQIKPGQRMAAIIPIGYGE